MAVNLHSSNQPHEKGHSSTPSGFRREGRAQAGGRTDLRLLHPSYLSSHISCCQFIQDATERWFLLVREATLAARHRPVATRCLLQWLAKVPKSLGSEMKTCRQNMLPSRRVFALLRIMGVGWHETAAITVLLTLISLALAKLTVISGVFCFCGAFKLSLQ